MWTLRQTSATWRAVFAEAPAGLCTYKTTCAITNVWRRFAASMFWPRFVKIFLPSTIGMKQQEVLVDTTILSDLMPPQIKVTRGAFRLCWACILQLSVTWQTHYSEKCLRLGRGYHAFWYLWTKRPRPRQLLILEGDDVIGNFKLVRIFDGLANSRLVRVSCSSGTHSTW